MKAQSDLVSNIIAVPDGKMARFTTPMILISYADGQKLRNTVTKGAKVHISVDFDAEPPTTLPQVSFWLYPGNHRSYESLLAIEHLVKAFDSTVQFEPKFFYLPSYSLGTDSTPYNDDYCYNNGDECSLGLTDSKPSLRQTIAGLNL